jgi:mycothiol synthase
MTDIEIRPFREEDRPAIVALQNARRPPHLQETVAEWERQDAKRPPEEVRLRLCAGEPAVAYLVAVDRGTSAWRKPGVCGLGLWVAREHQRQGIGGALYEKALEFARAWGLSRVTTYIRLFEPDEPAVPFLQKRGFAEVDREVPVILDLKTFDPSAFTRPAPRGIRLLSFADVPDTEENWRRLYELDEVVDRDIPTNGPRHEFPPFEQWRKAQEGPEWDPRAVILAENEAGDWIGLSALSFQEGTNIAWTNITGVLPEYRGRGIALALKLQAIAAAQARGCPLVTTENHEDNAPMRAINKKLGFTPDAPGVSYRKDL